MDTPGYLVSEATANYLRRAVGSAAPSLPVGRVALPAARGLLFAVVKVTGAASGGWHPGQVQRYIDAVGTTDGACEVQPTIGSLKATKVYLCVRTSDATGGTPRYVAIMPPLVARTVVTAVDFGTCTVTTDVGYFVDA